MSLLLENIGVLGLVIICCFSIRRTRSSWFIVYFGLMCIFLVVYIIYFRESYCDGF